MIRNFLESIFPYYIRKRIYYFRKLGGLENENKLNQIVSEVRNERPIKVLFIASTVPMWRGQGVYELINMDKRFEARIIISPYARYNRQEANYHTELLREYFNNSGTKFTDSQDGGFDLKEWLDDFDPSIIFFSQQYEGLHGNCLDLEWHSDKLRCFIPYGLPTIKEHFVYNLPSHNLFWRVYHATKLHLKTAKQIMANNAVNVRIVGDSDADLFLYSNHIDPWKRIDDGKIRKRIIWAPHFSIGCSGYLHRASFLWLFDGMIELSKRYSDRIQIAFKPHPHLHSVLCDLPDWGPERTDAYFKLWDSMPNTQFVDGKFQDLFVYSDGMIHDCGSFTGEYLFVRKPVMFMSKEIDTIRQSADDFGLQCLDLHYEGASIRDAETFITDIILGEHDDYKEKREKFFYDYLMPPGGNTVAQNIYNDIVDSLGL